MAWSIGSSASWSTWLTSNSLDHHFADSSASRWPIGFRLASYANQVLFFFTLFKQYEFQYVYGGLQRRVDAWTEILQL